MTSKKQPTVKEVIDLETGKIIRSEEILSQADSAQHKQRMADETAKIRREQVRYHCALCLEAVSIRGMRDQSFYFRHPDNPGAECPYRYINTLSPEQINAIKYDGAKESARHANIKRLLQQSLLEDHRVDPGSIHVEKRVKSISPDWTQWRQPDVQSKIDGRLFVFEIQLSTTFLTVVAGRREFYLRNGAMLIWIFDEELVAEKGMRFTERDVYHNNNRNLFFVNAQTLASSHQHGECRLMCQWEEPQIVDGTVSYAWKEQEISLHQITLDIPNQRAYFYDFDFHDVETKKHLISIKKAQEESLTVDAHEYLNEVDDWGDEDDDEGTAPATEFDRLMAKHAAEVVQHREKLLDRYQMSSPDRNTAENFGNYWIRAGIEGNEDKDQAVVWSYYHSTLSQACGDLPVVLPKDLRHLLCALYSLREGVVIGSALGNLKALENHIYAHYRWFYRYFAFGIRCYGKDEELNSLKPHSTCYKHLREYKVNRGKIGFVQNRTPDALIQYLFPELMSNA